MIPITMIMAVREVLLRKTLNAGMRKTTPSKATGIPIATQNALRRLRKSVNMIKTRPRPIKPLDWTTSKRLLT